MSTTNNLLSQKECSNAVAEWATLKCQYELLESMISPISVFNFSVEDCEWIKTHNENKMFHLYMGVHNGKIVLIAVPLNKAGEEITLDQYLNSEITTLESDLVITQEVLTKKIKSTTLSPNLVVTDRNENIQLPFENEPSVRKEISVHEILSWKYQCMDWFYHECNEYEGKRIFNNFLVPLSDLSRDDSEFEKVVCLFALKKSTILDKHLPTLLFVSVDKGSSRARFIEPDQLALENSKDFSTPCPPFCRQNTRFNIFD